MRLIDIEKALILARQIEKIGFKVFLRVPKGLGRRSLVRPKQRVMYRP